MSARTEGLFALMSRMLGCWSSVPGRAPLVASAMLAQIGKPETSVSYETADRASMASSSAGGRPAPRIERASDVMVVVEGALYNGRELGEGEDDPTVVAGLYRRHGFIETLRRINGDFAIALYDRRTNTLWLGRDRFGAKPLYYAAQPGVFAFSSRLRQLLRVPGASTEPNRQFVALFAGSHYRYFDNDPNASPYAGISQVPAAHALEVSLGGVRLSRYWTLEEAPDLTGSIHELAEQYRALLFEAVSRRLWATPRPAFTLSGGMDSSSVLASAVALMGAKQHAFSTVYADKTYDESAEIRSMLDTTVEHWHTVPVGTPDVADLVGQMVAVHDEPVATATWLPHFLLCREAVAAGFSGLFGGLGGDELNAGEYEHFFYYFADLRQSRDLDRLDREVRCWVEHHDHPIFRKTAAGVQAAFARLVDFDHPGRCRADRARLERYAAALSPEYFDLGAFEPVMYHPFRSYLRNRTWQDLTLETIPCCLRAEDRQTSAFGLDNVLPFLDHTLVEFMFRVPGVFKFRDGVSKRLLREAMDGVLPEETRTRVKKTGWNAPAHVWFSGAGRTMLLDFARSQRFREYGIYNVNEVCRIIDEHDEIVRSGRAQENHMMFLWQLLNLATWLELNERPIAGPPVASSGPALSRSS